MQGEPHDIHGKLSKKLAEDYGTPLNALKYIEYGANYHSWIYRDAKMDISGVETVFSGSDATLEAFGIFISKNK